MSENFTEDYSSLFGTEYSKGRFLYLNDPNTFLRAAFALLLRAGFILIQLGCVPVENVYVILLQNIISIAVSVTAYCFLGFYISFGKDSFYGLIGFNTWIGDQSANMDEAVLGFSACLIGTAIITTILSGRITFAFLIIITVLYSALLQPIIMHWVWHSQGIMNKYKLFNKRVSIKDQAGDVVVHVSASVIGLIVLTFLGRRVVKLSDLDQFSIKSESSGSTVTGYFFVLIGLMAFSLPTPNLKPTNYTGLIVINNFLAMVAGFLVVTLLQVFVNQNVFQYWIIIRSMQGAVAGTVSLAAGIDVYSPLVAFSIAAVASFVYFLVASCLHHSCLEDCCNVTAIFLVCGILGALAPTLCGRNENLTKLNFLHLTWQVICLASVLLFLIIFITILTVFIASSGLLRNNFERVNHFRSDSLRSKLRSRFFFKRLFATSQNSSYITPGTSLANLDKIMENEGQKGSSSKLNDSNQTKQDKKVRETKFLNKSTGLTIDESSSTNPSIIYVTLDKNDVNKQTIFGDSFQRKLKDSFIGESTN